MNGVDDSKLSKDKTRKQSIAVRRGVVADEDAEDDGVLQGSGEGELEEGVGVAMKD